MKEEGERGK